jgi:hypothetical protein
MSRIFSSAEPSPQLTWTAMISYPRCCLRLNTIPPLSHKKNARSCNILCSTSRSAQSAIPSLHLSLRKYYRGGGEMVQAESLSHVPVPRTRFSM